MERRMRKRKSIIISHTTGCNPLTDPEITSVVCSQWLSQGSRLCYRNNVLVAFNNKDLFIAHDISLLTVGCPHAVLFMQPYSRIQTDGEASVWNNPVSAMTEDRREVVNRTLHFQTSLWKWHLSLLILCCTESSLRDQICHQWGCEVKSPSEKGTICLWTIKQHL